MDQLLTEKYRPQELENFIGNKKQINDALLWINDFKNQKPNTKKFLLISGPPGTGKTTFANILLKQNGYDVIEYNASDVRSQKLVNDSLTKILNYKNISQLVENKEKITGIIMDEIDGMSSGDRGGVQEFIRLISPSKGKGRKKKDHKEYLKIKNPVICICNNSIEKKINDLKKIAYSICFKKPSYYDMENILTNITTQENIKIEDDVKALVIYSCQYDIRKLINTLMEIKKYSGTTLDSDAWDKLSQNSLNKDIDYGLYDSVGKCLNSFENYDKALKYYEVDKNLVGMMIHENYPDYIHFNTDSCLKKKYNCTKNMLNNFCVGDIIDNYIYNEQYWDLFDICGTIKIGGPSFELNTLKKKKINNYQEIRFTSILNKSTMQCIHFKSVLNLADKFRCNIETTYVIIDYILYNIFNENGNIQKGIQILNDYDIGIDNIDKLLKVNKKYKDKYTDKFKKLLIKLNSE